MAKKIITNRYGRDWAKGGCLSEGSRLYESCVEPGAGGSAVHPLSGGWALSWRHTEVVTLQQGSREEEHIGARQGLSDAAVFSCKKFMNVFMKKHFIFILCRRGNLSLLLPAHKRKVTGLIFVGSTTNMHWWFQKCCPENSLNTHQNKNASGVDINYCKSYTTLKF